MGVAGPQALLRRTIRYSSARHVYRRLDEPHRDAALLLASRIIADDKRYTAPFQDVEPSTKYFL